MRRYVGITFATAFLSLSLAGCGQPESVAKTAAAPVANITGDESVSKQALAAAIAPLFDDPTMAETRAVVVMHGGKVIAERYAPGYGPDTRLISWSMAKTVTGLLVGMMIADGRLALDEPAPVPEWDNPADPRTKITIRHLMNMASGLAHDEGASDTKPIYEADTPRMLFLDGRDNVARYAEGHSLEGRPGKNFKYSTATTHILADIMTDSLTPSKDPEVRRAAMWEYAKGRLFEPLGMTSAYPEFDRSGTLLGGSIIHATARDWAKLGEFIRNNGSVKSAQLLPTSWTRFMRTTGADDPAYGAQLWLNKRRPAGSDQVLFPDKGRSDIFAALGHLGQFIVGSPAQRLTVVRLGKTQDKDLRPIDDQLAKIFALFPAS